MMHFEHLDRTDRQKFEILQIQDGGGRYLENLKIVLSQPRFERFQQNLVWWCSSTLSSIPTVKNFKFEKSKITAVAILKNWKIEKSPYLGRGSTDFDEIWHGGAVRTSSFDRPDRQKLKILQIQSAAGILTFQKLRYLGNGMSNLVTFQY